MSETTEITIIVAVAAVVVCMIIAGFVLLAKSKSKAKGGDSSGRHNFVNPMYADVNNHSMNIKLAPAQLYEASAPAMDNEMDC